MQHMQRALNGTFALGLGLTFAAVAAVGWVPHSVGQSGPGWTVLLDDKNMGDWDKVGETAASHHQLLTSIRRAESALAVGSLAQFLQTILDAGAEPGKSLL